MFIADHQNIAWAPGTTTTLVSVDTINDATLADYFTFNQDPPASQNLFVYNLQYDGFTTSTSHPYLTASKTVPPGTTHRVKLVIADLGDAVYDSAVFVKNKRPLPCP